MKKQGAGNDEVLRSDHPENPRAHRRKARAHHRQRIAGLAAAVYLVQDAKMPGKNITIYEARPNLGGCLEAFGSAEDGYLSTGAREPEPYFQCMGITASSEFS